MTKTLEQLKQEYDAALLALQAAKAAEFNAWQAYSATLFAANKAAKAAADAKREAA